MRRYSAQRVRRNRPFWLQKRARRSREFCRQRLKKQSAILRAEAEKEAAIRVAEGEAQAILEVQKATAEGLRMLNEANPNNSVIAIKGLEAFAKAADGKATKIIIPSEIQGLAGLVTSIGELAEKTDGQAK